MLSCQMAGGNQLHKEIVMEDVLIGEDEVAKQLGFSPQTLRTWRRRVKLGQKAPNLSCFKIGTSVKYRKSDVDAFIESCRVK